MSINKELKQLIDTNIFKKLKDSFQLEGTSSLNLLKLVPAMKKVAKKLKESDYTLDFIKENSLWYIDLPDWPLDRSHLLMVQGADDMLDEIAHSQELSEATVSLKAKPSGKVWIQSNQVLLMRRHTDTMGLAATYGIHTQNEKNVTKEAWLCPVITFVYGSPPENILITII